MVPFGHYQLNCSTKFDQNKRCKNGSFGTWYKHFKSPQRTLMMRQAVSKQKIIMLDSRVTFSCHWTLAIVFLERYLPPRYRALRCIITWCLLNCSSFHQKIYAHDMHITYPQCVLPNITVLKLFHKAPKHSEITCLLMGVILALNRVLVHHICC